MLDALTGALGVIALLLGLGLSTVGLYGLLRRTDIFEQLHAAGLVTGSGVILVLVAALGTGSAEIITSAFLVIAFLLITSSLSTHVIALTAWRRREGYAALGEPTRSAADRLVTQRSGDAVPVPMRVLIAHDGTPAAGVAIGLVSGLALPERSAIRLVGVLEGDIALDAHEPAAEDSTDEGAELAEALAGAVRRLQRPAVAVEPIVRRGRPTLAIVEEAAAFGARLIVMGTRDLGRVRTILEGSVAGEVLEAAPCPVLIARSPEVRHVLLAIDGSAPSDAAIDVVAGWPIFEGMDVDVISVGSPPTPQRSVTDRAVARLREAGLEAAPHVLSGEVRTAITSFADRRSVDLIVVGTRGHSGLKRVVLGSVARDVVSSARTSVLVVKS